MPLMAHEYVLYVTFFASKIALLHPNRDASKNVPTLTILEFTKFDVLARFPETIPAVKSVSSSEIYRINFGIFYQNYNFTLFPEIGISRVLHSPLLKRKFVPKFWTITITHMHMQRALYHACKLVISIFKRLNHVPLSLNKKG